MTRNHDKSTIAPLLSKVFRRAGEERCSPSFAKLPLFKFLCTRGGNEMMGSKRIDITIKPKLFYKFMIFKIQFQYLFNSDIADQTIQWMLGDIEAHTDKYFKIIQE